jgi:hypothetical protein
MSFNLQPIIWVLFFWQFSYAKKIFWVKMRESLMLLQELINVLEVYFQIIRYSIRFPLKHWVSLLSQEKSILRI